MIQPKPTIAATLKSWTFRPLPTELALKPANYPLLPLARGAKLAQFIGVRLEQGLMDYLRLTLDIGLLSDPDVVWRKMMEAIHMQLQIREDTWPYMDEFFRTIPEAMQKVTTFREALEESKKQGERQGEQRGVQQSVLHVLQHKFGELPTEVVYVIETTADLERLEQWLEQALDSDALADLDFSPTEEQQSPCG
ncbi:MAG: hypothetical protein R3E79_32340 [Caldilineaceae bacterium]